MAFDNFLAERIRTSLKNRGIPFEDKKMMGGLCFMVDDKMFLGIVKDQLMARLDPEIYSTVISKPGVTPMDFTGKSMKGFVFVSPSAIDLDSDLEFWVALCLEFNPRAKRSK